MADQQIKEGKYSVVSRVLVYGGSFDPVHLGHLALARELCELLEIQQLRLLPAGQQPQKARLQASAADRVAMLELAFADWTSSECIIDQREIVRAAAGASNYTYDSLLEIRQELGPDCALFFALGADQLQNLSSWHRWRELFELANLCAVSRPGYDTHQLPDELAALWHGRQLNAEQIRHKTHGASYLAPNLAVAVSATQLRTELAQTSLQQAAGKTLPIPAKVLDYLQLHTIY